MSDGIKTSLSSVVTWQWVAGLAGAILLLVLTGASTVTGFLASKGIENLIKQEEKNQAQVSELSKKIDDTLCKADIVHSKQDKRLDRLEVLVTIPFEKRMELLKNMTPFYLGGKNEQ
jgi:hypothetical protein